MPHLHPYGVFHGPSVLDPQQAAPSAPMATKMPEEKTFVQTVFTSAFVREVAVEGLKAAVIAAIVILATRGLEGK